MLARKALQGNQLPKQPAPHLHLKRGQPQLCAIAVQPHALCNAHRDPSQDPERVRVQQRAARNQKQHVGLHDRHLCGAQPGGVDEGLAQSVAVAREQGRAWLAELALAVVVLQRVNGKVVDGKELAFLPARGSGGLPCDGLDHARGGGDVQDAAERLDVACVDGPEAQGVVVGWVEFEEVLGEA